MVVAQGEAGDRRLVAYLVAEGVAAPDARDLRAFLRSTLPDYLIPSVFVELAAIPLNPNGKVDRAALPAPQAARPRTEYVAPRSDTEAALAGLWADLLGLDQVGVTDDFFVLGGHSLLATQVMSRVRNQFRVELELAMLFDHPTVAELAELVDAAVPGALAPPIVPVPRDGPLPLSFAQQRLWFLDQLEPGSSEYNEPLALRLTGPLDLDALRAALDALVERHEVLRTRLVAGADGVAYQVIDPVTDAGLVVLDLSDSDDPFDRAARWVAADAVQPFDLAAGPLMRARLIRLAAEDHVLSMCSHHVISDEWSVGLLRHELIALYRAFRRGEHPLPPPAVQYADFAVWQRGWFQGEVLERQLAYWQNRLADAPALQMPTDRPRPPVRSSAGARVAFTIPAEVTQGLRTVTRTSGATTFMTLFSAYAVLLGQYTGQDDIVAGTPIANRNRAEIEDLIGFFVNALVLRTDLSGDPTFADLVGRVRREALAAYAHQDLPFEQLVDALVAERDRSRTPIFQVLFNYNQDDVGGSQAEHEEVEPGLAMSPARMPGPISIKFDLRLIVDDEGGQLSGAIEYSTALFTADTIERLVTRLLTLLRAVAEDSGRRLSELPNASAAERRELAGWNDTQAPVPALTGVHELIAAQAARTPDAAALVSGPLTTSYAELEERANRLARYLRAAGVGAETVVGLALGQGTDAIVALLAVWKAGGAYLPLDPGYPAERLAYLLADSRASILLGTQDVLAELPGGRARAIALDDPTVAAAVEAEPATTPDVAVHPDQTAYLIYTSGSTGRPKGVQITHRSLINYVHAIPDAAVLGGARRSYLLLQPLATDFGNTTIFGCLATGGTLHVGPPDMVTDAGAVSAYLRNEAIDYLKIVPSHLAALAGTHGLPELLPARTLVLGGEAAPESLIEGLVAAAGERAVVNHYGPTETTIGVATSRLTGGPVTIGQPVANVRLHVVDRSMAQVPVGAVGELCIAGAALARGYRNRPDLTAERFVADPFGGDGARLYRSGDRVRRLPDGRLQFLERLDDQIKLRGHRIEPAEIEARLLAHASVAAAVVVAAGGRLVAYLVPADGELPETAELRTHLQQALPEHMIPAAFVGLEALPLTPNGKLDRAALPAPDAGRPGPDHTYQGPRTPTEELLAGIWTDILALDRVGTTDNFFELGGHSLLATQVVSRIRTVFDLELSLAVLFDHPTVAELAAVLDGGDHRPAAPPVTPAGRDGHLPLSFSQQRLWFLGQLERGSTEYNNADATRLRGDLDTAALQAALDELMARHEVLRTRLVTGDDGEPYQVIDPPGRFELRHTDLTGRPETELHALLAADAREPYDLAVGPVARARLVRLGPDDHVFCLLLHHVVSDEWSAFVLRSELAALYAACRAGEPSPLAPLPVQYADYAAWQRTWLQGEVLERQLDYWREHLAGAPMLELPTDRPRPATWSAASDRVEFRVPAEAVGGLGRVARETGATTFMTLLAAFTVLLGRYSGQDDIVLGTPIAGRSRSEIEGLLGFFINSLMIRADLSGDPTFAELTARIRREALQAYAHQDLPFERLVDALQPERERGRTPLFTVMFSLDRVGDTRLELPGLTAEPFPVERQEARLDLTIGLHEEADGGLTGLLVYSTALYDRATIERLGEHLVSVLAAVSADPGLRLTQIPVPAPEAPASNSAPDVVVAAPSQGMFAVHELFAAHARRRPQAPAVSAGGSSLTYAELDRRANRLANHLHGMGVGPDTVVGLCLERGIDLIVAVLAVWKAGGAYLALDPEYPVERLAYMLGDARVSVLLGGGELIGDLPVGGVRTVVLDDPVVRAAIDRAPHGTPPVAVEMDQMAYVIYTSGSTGRPKGVQVTHRGLANLLLAQRAFTLAEDDVVLQFAAFGFDASVWEVALAMSSGAALVIAPAEARTEPAKLAALIRDRGVTFTLLPPSLLTMLTPGDLDGLRTLLAGGERLSPELAAAWGGRHRFVNAYGPTEASVCVSMAVIDPVAGEAPPIGSPLVNVRLYVLDRSLNQVPLGVPGELYVGGTGVARGYGNRPELTGERFLADPFAGDGGRMYRTGDRARQRVDGRLEYLGRVDDQVKVRGFRIEPAEIEAALREHGDLAAAVVVADGRDADRRLVAYVVPADAVQGVPPAAELRTLLRRRLPDYMVPAVFIELAVLPLTPSGKVDKAALPDPDGAYLGDGYVAPRTPAEERLAGIWSEILEVDRVGIHDDFFFKLGGHSLLATRVASQVRLAFGIELELAALFDEPTVAGLATLIDGTAAELPAPPIVPVPRDGLLPLSFAQQRLWFLAQLEPGSVEYNASVPLRWDGPLDVEVLERAFAALVARHEVLRTRLVVGPDGEPTQVIDPPPAGFEVPIVDVPAEADPRDLIAVAARAPFDLATGPLLRASILRLSPDRHIVALVMHHVVADEWSTRVIRDELTALYDGRELPDLPVQYADFAVWQRERLSGAVRESQLGYWRSTLAGAPTLVLPTDRPHPAVRSSEGAVLEFSVPAEVADGLRALSRTAGASMFMTVLSAYAMVLSFYSGQDDVVVGTPIANRNRAEIEGLVGFFVNTLVLRTDLSGDPSFTELLARVRQQTLDAYAHQDLPFEQLVDELVVERDRSRTPLFQALFDYFTADEDRPDIGAGEPRVSAAKFDLRLIVTDAGPGAALSAAVEFSTALYDEDRIRRMTGHLGELLAAVAQDADRPLSALPILTGDERTRMLLDWNRTAQAATASGVDELFAAAVTAGPERIAVVSGAESVTYAELAARADGLAQYLQSCGVGTETVVGVCLPRGVDLIVALLAVWKAGAAYLPLDPGYPAERLAFMLTDSRVPVVIGNGDTLDGLPAGGRRVVALDAPAVVAAGPSPDPVPSPEAHPDRLAYVIYTSGSTGRPKGVQVTQRGLVNYLSWAKAAYGPSAGAGSPVHSPVTFDLTVTSLFVPLLSGSPVVLVDEGPSGLLEAAADGPGFDLVKLTPGHLGLLAEALPAGRRAGLARRLVVGGEALSGALTESWLRDAPDSVIVNEYGPTETVVGCCVFEVAAGDPVPASVPIGRPIAGTRLYALDEALRPVPVGVPGELFVGGAGVARGYCGPSGPDGRAVRGRSHHRRTAAGSTGPATVVRWRADGELEFLGRADEQVKVRGYRIEPGEVEAVLRRHPGVAGAVVARGRGRRLVAYVVPADPAAGAPADLRDVLGGSLPEYLVPAVFVELAALPLTANGKVDRAALPSPDGLRPESAGGFAAPRTPTEEVLAGIWGEVLGLDRVGAHDDFFELGGHSLLATQVMSRIRLAFGVEIPLAVLFDGAEPGRTGRGDRRRGHRGGRPADPRGLRATACCRCRSLSSGCGSWPSSSPSRSSTTRRWRSGGTDRWTWTSCGRPSPVWSRGMRCCGPGWWSVRAASRIRWSIRRPPRPRFPSWTCPRSRIPGRPPSG